MRLSISTRFGVSKAVFDGFAIIELTEADLERLRQEIWVALLEMDLAKQQAQEFENEEAYALRQNDVSDARR